MTTFVKSMLLKQVYGNSHQICKSYQKAKKKLTVLEAPNILTIVLKRFRSSNLEKLDKLVQFPEVLNLAPFMSGTSDKCHIYSLYGLVVHLDIMNAAYSGHYISYVKDFQGDWFRIDDSRDLEKEELPSHMTRVVSHFEDNIGFFFSFLLKACLRVYCRLRPLSGKEISEKERSVLTNVDEFTVEHMWRDDKVKQHMYDHVFDGNVTQEDVFEDTKYLVQSAVDGYNVCIFAYGQTGSGKTFTIYGSESNPGLTPLCMPPASSSVIM
ncbi:Kinesin (KAR3 subfamily) [Abeliophyllum distichum]|uniref:Kinesin (KAR3 subfamily) n=1 Tax=Abeliophyllum distichum TaxID=126358 RepID=A0ABD1RE22_9LAMI